MKAVADASSLIHPAKVPRFWSLLRNTFQEIMIPEAVYREILAGRSIQSSDVPVIEEAISERWVKVVRVVSLPRLPQNLGRGEREAIALMEQSRVDWLLMDDLVASTTARLRGLPVRPIAYLPIYWRRREIVSRAEAARLIDELVKSGYYLSSRDYLSIMEHIT